MKSSSIAGNLLTISDTHDDRILSAVGEDVIAVDYDFLSPAVAANVLAGWVATLVGTSTVTAADAAGGALLLTTGGTENDGVNLQALGESFLPSTNNHIYFYAKFEVSEAIHSDFFVGLSKTSTGILGGLPVRIGFRKVDESADLMFECEGTGTTSVEGVHTMVDATAVELEFFYDAGSDTVRYYVNGTKKGEITPGANLPAEELAVAAHFLTGAGSAETMTIDRLRVIQIGR